MNTHCMYVNNLHIQHTHLLYRIFFLGMLTSATPEWESWESVICHQVLKAYPTCHSWIITTHVSLGDLEKQWKMFLQWKARSQLLLNSLQQKPLVSSCLLSVLQEKSANLDSIYTSYKPLNAQLGTQLLKREPSFNGMSLFSKCTKRSPLSFLGDALSWLTWTAMTTDVKIIKKKINQVIETQTQQQETLGNVISVLNVTGYAMQINRQHINAVIEEVGMTHNDVTTLFNITSSIYTHINYQQFLLHICSILANLRDSLYYMRQIVMHVMDYIDAATTSILSLHVFPVEDLREILIHIKAELPSTMHLPVSWDDLLHFYRYLLTHILDAEEQFLLLIDVPIQDHAQQLKIYQVFKLFISKGNLSACYNIDTKY